MDSLLHRHEVLEHLVHEIVPRTLARFHLVTDHYLRYRQFLFIAKADQLFTA